ncbi:unnamed protein product [Polarella glacialis]|uniref:Uncharacterized protein n=1 Tax=Polarella glacialis TaxID=89957 RepID=A0A813I2K7_POLGL|nr:unnamed protein product [Polarella glacialis]
MSYQGVDWRDISRHLNPRTAERPWPSESLDGTSSALWTELTDSLLRQGSEEAEDSEVRLVPPVAPSGLDAAPVPTSLIFASHSPALLWVGGNRLLAVAGCYSPDIVGGAIQRPLHDVYLLDLPDMSTSAAAPATCPDLRATRLDCGTAGGRLPHGHPCMNGAASDFDPIRKTAFFFGGGAPHSGVSNATSALRLCGWEAIADADTSSCSSVGLQGPSARWEVVGTSGSVEAGTLPLARQGLKGTVFRDEFIIFGGRALGGECMDDVWSLDLTSSSSPAAASTSPQRKLSWRQLTCEGQGPSPRVWYGACHAVHGKWFIYGGSTWQFEEPEGPHDYRSLFILDLAQRQWSSVDPSPGPVPPWSVASALVPLGCSQLLLLGGTMPYRLGSEGLNGETLRHWREWPAPGVVLVRISWRCWNVIVFPMGLCLLKQSAGCVLGAYLVGRRAF